MKTKIVSFFVGLGLLVNILGCLDNNTTSSNSPHFNKNLSSSSSAPTPTASHTPSASTTTLTISDTAPAYGANVTITAIVTGSSPTGTVTFTGNIYANNNLGSCTLSGGKCSVVINNFLPGTQIVAASYGGDANNTVSNTNEHHITVGPRTLMASTTTLTASATTVPRDSTLTLTAIVAPAPTTGNVKFVTGSTTLATIPIQGTSGSGISGSLFGLSLGGTASPVGTDNANGPVYPNMPYGVTRSASQPSISWTYLNTASGTYDWTNLDAWVAQNVGRDLLFGLGGPPSWASLYPSNTGKSGTLGACAPPSNISYWNEWVTAVVTRYSKSIKYWEIWNEPQDPGFFCGATSGSPGSIPTMVTLAKSAYSIIKSIAPSAQIVSPVPTQWGYKNSPGSEWMTTFLADGGGATFDILGFHGYLWINNGEAELENQVVSQVNSVMTVAKISKPIWDTEASWCCDVVLAQNRQPGFVSKMYLLHQSLGVERLIWFQYAGIPLTGQMFNNSTGENANVPAFNETYRWLVGATLSTPCSTEGYGALITCGYTRPGGYKAQAVWESNSTGATYSYTYPAGMTQYRDLTGAVHPLSGGTVMIGDAPILLENGNSSLTYAATFSTAGLPVGRYPITAVYEGNTYYDGSTSSPQTITITPKTTQVAGGDQHACAISSGGAQCWGNNQYGQLGNNSYVNSATPVSVTGLTSGVTDISGGTQFTCAVVSGAAKCWGGGGNGRLGNGLSKASPVPVQVSGLTSGVTAIANGGSHACAIANGGLWCWGLNSYGQLGDKSTTSSPTPVLVTGFTSGVTAVTAGDNHTCAIKSGSVWCWGENNTGQLGVPYTIPSSPSPLQVTNLIGEITAIAAGELHTCAVVDGGVQCWGYNFFDQLGGVPYEHMSWVPVAVTGLSSGVTAISSESESDSTCVIVNGGAKCWGLNSAEQLGNNSTTNSITPVQVIGLNSGVTDIGIGGGFGCAIASSGISCWGDAPYGVLR